MIPEVRGEEGNLPPADSLKQKRAQLGHINKMITLITSKRGKPENIQLKLKECLAKARACGDDPFLEKFSKHVDNFTGYTPQKKTKLRDSIKEFQKDVDRDVRALTREGKKRPREEAVEEEVVRVDDARMDIDQEEEPLEAPQKRGREEQDEGFVSTAVRSVGDFAYRYRRQSVDLASVAIALATNMPALRETPNWLQFMGGCLVVAADAGKTRLFLSPLTK